MTDKEPIATLYTLGDRGETIDGTVNDVRGYTVEDTDGTDIGKVSDLLVDDQEHKVRFLVIEHGGFLGMGESKTLLPVQAVTKITHDKVLIDQTRERVASAPGYVPHLVDDRVYHANIADHFGYVSHWGHGYLPDHTGTYHL